MHPMHVCTCASSASDQRECRRQAEALQAEADEARQAAANLQAAAEREKEVALREATSMHTPCMYALCILSPVHGMCAGGAA